MVMMMTVVVSVGWQQGGGEWVVVMERRVAASGCGDRIDRVTPITTQPSTSKPQKKQSRRKQRKDFEVPHPSDSTADVPNEEHVPTHSNDLLLSAQEITNLKLRVKKLKKKARLRTHKFKRLYKGRSRIEAIDRDAEVTLVETQRRNDENDDNLMFDTSVFDGDEIVVETEEPVINAATTTKSNPSARPKEKDAVQESSENVSTATTMVSTTTTTIVATPAITTPLQERAKGISFKSTVTTTIPYQKSKDKGKAIMIDPEKPVKKKDQIELDEELKAAQEEASRTAIYEEWDNEQAMMEADYELVADLQENEREAMSIEEKSRRLAELIRERKKFFAAQRAEAIRNKPPTKTQRRNQMIQYLKNMEGYSHALLKDKSFDEVQKEESSEKKAEGSRKKKSIGRKRAKDKQEQQSSKRQRVEDDKEEEELKKCFELAKEEEIAINAIPLATKVPVVEDLVNLWKLVKAKHEDNRPEEDFEKVLWGDLRVMLEPDVESKVRRSLQGYKRYPLTPIIITNMLNKKLQTDQWNEMVYQLLKLMIQKMNIKFREGLLGLKGFLKLLLLSTAATKVNVAGLQLLEELLLSEG
ncbi:hypothetical protein Tco_1081013 [Tanacetum coccineum]|uniref:Uncharacterized protein n=1 Tax=Tanacetum coccineum TaxID=301880 RepID=A0ABQ5HYB0_9ASTR